MVRAREQARPRAPPLPPTRSRPGTTGPAETAPTTHLGPSAPRDLGYPGEGKLRTWLHRPIARRAAHDFCTLAGRTLRRLSQPGQASEPGSTLFPGTTLFR